MTESDPNAMPAVPVAAIAGRDRSRRAEGPLDLRHRLYEDVRRMARRGLRSERRGHTLQTTELAHEALLRLEEVAARPAISESHFLAIAATTIRRVLVDHARRRRARRRGGEDAVRVPLDAALLELTAPAVEVLDLHHALGELSRHHERAARVVEWRFFGGMSEEQVAIELDVSRATVARDWRWARAWLRRRLEGVAPEHAGVPG